VSVPGRFNGPLASGNGGYSAAVFAGLLDGPAAVSLRSPVPLDRDLAVEPDGDGLRVSDGESLVATVEPAAELDLDVPDPVSVEEAREASARYRGLADGEFCRCFVCGRAREDSLGVFAGAVAGRDVVASPWAPPPWAADASGRVAPEIVSAVLDCPTYFALYMHGDLRTSFLARFQARIDAPVPVGEELVAIAWPIGAEGRKLHAGSALLGASGAVLAVARALLVEPRQPDRGQNAFGP
jgi:hypothetical protein